METKKLQSRWLEKDETFAGTRREAMIHTLKTRCAMGSTNRPLRLDLRGIDLSRLDFSGLDLSGYDFTSAVMSRVNLSCANLGHTILQNTAMDMAVLDECEFIGANLRLASLNECSAKNCGFGGADLTQASLINANVNQAVFSRSILVEADLRAADLTGARLSEANLARAVFTRAILYEADLKHSDVSHTHFGLADMRRCRLLGIKNFKKADWVGADVREMDLRGAYLVRRYISDENYLFEFRGQGRWYKVLYWLWWFTSDCGRSLIRWFVWLVGATLAYAGIYTLVPIDYGPNETWFSPIYFSFVTLTTLGYGDALPVSVPAQIVVSLQAITGYMGLGGLLSILGNKMARRAE